MERGQVTTERADAGQKRLLTVLLWLILTAGLGIQVAGGAWFDFELTWLPTVTIVVFVSAAFWMLRHDRLQLAIALVNACFFLAAAIPVLLSGLADRGTGLAYFFVPVALAGMARDRSRLIMTVVGSLIVVYTSLVLHDVGLLSPDDGPQGILGLLTAAEFTLAVLIVTFVLDRFGRVNKRALVDALTREAELRKVVAERLEMHQALVGKRRDIEALNRQLEDRVGHLTALIQVDTALSTGLGSSETLQILLRQVISRLNVDAVAVLRFDRATTRLRWHNGLGFSTNAINGTVLTLGEGIAGKAGLERKAQYAFDKSELQAHYVRWPLIKDEGIEFYAAVPLVANGELEGVLELFHRSALDPDEDWREFLLALATQAALVLNSNRMMEDLEQSNLELREAYDTTIEGWSRALDLRDHETEGHSRRVTDLTVALARRMGAPEDKIRHIRRGALLHDIGKMGVPDSILLKPGPLTAEERQIMERHTTYAFELLKPIEFLQPALKIPHCHHENWDGTGYPQGLKGTDIPLAARVFSVVDVYDALTSDRPYREAWSADQALEHIRKQANLKFDPAVVEQFLQMMAERQD